MYKVDEFGHYFETKVKEKDGSHPTQPGTINDGKVRKE
jgi:hypothetical protein